MQLLSKGQQEDRVARLDRFNGSIPLNAQARYLPDRRKSTRHRVQIGVFYFRPRLPPPTEFSTLVTSLSSTSTSMWTEYSLVGLRHSVIVCRQFCLAAVWQV